MPNGGSGARLINWSNTLGLIKRLLHDKLLHFYLNERLKTWIVSITYFSNVDDIYMKNRRL